MSGQSSNPKLPAVSNDGGGSNVTDYLKEHADSGGIFIKWAKDGKYRKISDDEEIPMGKEFVVPYDQIQVGWIKFLGKGNTPERIMGPLFGDFVMPKRGDLGDDDESLWGVNLSNEPDDPWKSQILLPLLDEETGDLYVFGTVSKTGRKSIGRLISHCERLAQRKPDAYPRVKLAAGGYQDRRFGWVATPSFPVIGEAPKGNKPALANDFNDEIPPFN